MEEKEKEELKDNWSTILLTIAEVFIIMGAFALLEVIGIKNVNTYGKIIFGFSFICVEYY